MSSLVSRNTTPKSPDAAVHKTAEEPPRLRILLADDHAIVRAGAKGILGQRFNAEFGEAKDARETIAAACDQPPWDIIVLDITMPGRSGVDLLGDLSSCCPKTPVLVLTAHDEEHFGVRVMRAGAAGFLMKSSMLGELVKAVEKVLGGGRYVSEQFGERLAAALQQHSTDGHEALSTREFEILRMIAGGKTGKEIAADLGISFKTVSTYRTRLSRKLGIRSNVELAQYAAREGLV